MKLGDEEEEKNMDATKGIIDVLLEMGSLDGRPITKENIEVIVFVCIHYNPKCSFSKLFGCSIFFI